MKVDVVEYALPSTAGVETGAAAELPLASGRAVSRAVVWGTFGAIFALYALLWSPNWYPLSDSSLYLNMARGLMHGRGYEYLRTVHRDVRPLTPLMLFAIMKLGGGIGTMHAVMIGLIVASHVLAFLTLRRWFNERVALLAVVATAGSWWTFANAFSIMTEPMFLVFFWAAMLVLSGVPGERKGSGRQWARVVGGALLMAGAFENRVAAVLLLPGTFFGLWMTAGRDVPWRTRAAWLAVFCVVFAGLYLEWKRPWRSRNVVAGQTDEGGGGLLASGTTDDVSRAEGYRMNVLVDVRNPLVQLPVSAGRWLVEALAAPTEVPFESTKKGVLAVAGAGAFAVFLVACGGWWRLLKARRWYAVGMAAYFVPYWVMWGYRIKPRYMMPILPLIFVQLWLGLALLTGWALRARGDDRARRRVARWVAGGILGAMLVLNGVPYGIDWYLRHGTRLNFYDVARRGAFAELVDIGAYVKRHASPSDEVWMNASPNRRIAQFLCDREVRTLTPPQKRRAADVIVMSPEDRRALDVLFSSRVSPKARWVLVFYEQHKWPSYHLPLVKSAPAVGSPPRWWQLYHRESRSAPFVPVAVPVSDRSEVRRIPGVGDGFGTVAGRAGDAAGAGVDDVQPRRVKGHGSAGRGTGNGADKP